MMLVLPIAERHNIDSLQVVGVWTMNREWRITQRWQHIANIINNDVLTITKFDNYVEL